MGGILADHTPQALDDQLKKISFESLSKAFGKVSPATMLKAIPVTMPMTHIMTVGGTRMEGVARYPLDAWLTAGNPCFTVDKWAMVCMCIAERGMDMGANEMFNKEDSEVFEKLFTVSSAMTR